MKNPVLAEIGNPARTCQSPGVSSGIPLDLDGAMLLKLTAIPYPFTPSDSTTFAQDLVNEQAELDFGVVMYLTGLIASNPGVEPTGASIGPRNNLQGIANKTGVIFQYTLSGDKGPVVYTPGPYFPGE